MIIESPTAQGAEPDDGWGRGVAGPALSEGEAAMKAEHRKELQTNVLADKLGHAIQGLKEGPSRNTVLVGALVALVVLLIVTWYYFSSSAQAGNSARWLQWDSLADPRQLETFADDKEIQGSMQGRAAQFQIARLNLIEGLQRFGSNRGDAAKTIRKAADLYEKLEKDSRDTPLLQQEALMGAARAFESLGELDKAKSYYEKLTQTYPATALGKSAQKQLDRLGSEAVSKDLRDLAAELNPSAAPVRQPPGTP
jgi:hypothetical protein